MRPPRWWATVRTAAARQLIGPIGEHHQARLLPAPASPAELLGTGYAARHLALIRPRAAAARPTWPGGLRPGAAAKKRAATGFAVGVGHPRTEVATASTSPGRTRAFLLTLIAQAAGCSGRGHHRPLFDVRTRPDRGTYGSGSPAPDGTAELWRPGPGVVQDDQTRKLFGDLRPGVGILPGGGRAGLFGNPATVTAGRA